MNQLVRSRGCSRKDSLQEVTWIVATNQQQIHPVTFGVCRGERREKELRMTGTIIERMVSVCINVVILDNLPFEEYTPPSEDNSP